MSPDYVGVGPPPSYRAGDPPGIYTVGPGTVFADGVKVGHTTPSLCPVCGAGTPVGRSHCDRHSAFRPALSALGQLDQRLEEFASRAKGILRDPRLTVGFDVGADAGGLFEDLEKISEKLGRLERDVTYMERQQLDRQRQRDHVHMAVR